MGLQGHSHSEATKMVFSSRRPSTRKPATDPPPGAKGKGREHPDLCETRHEDDGSNGKGQLAEDPNHEDADNEEELGSISREQESDDEDQESDDESDGYSDEEELYDEFGFEYDDEYMA